MSPAPPRSAGSPARRPATVRTAAGTHGGEGRLQGGRTRISTPIARGLSCAQLVHHRRRLLDVMGTRLAGPCHPRRQRSRRPVDPIPPLNPGTTGMRRGFFRRCRPPRLPPGSRPGTHAASSVPECSVRWTPGLSLAQPRVAPATRRDRRAHRNGAPAVPPGRVRRPAPV